MKIWFDLSNSPHINMFRTMIGDLQRSHEVIVTSRPLANTEDLLRMHRIPHTTVGVHYGRSLIGKTFGFPIRIAQLVRFLRRRGVEVAVSQSSFHSPVVARLLGIRSVYLNDNEHAAGNVPAFACADRIMVPEFLTARNLRRQGASLAKVERYPGVKEGIYLWEYAQRCRAPTAAPARVRRSQAPPRIFVRPEPWTAQYYRGPRNFLDDVIGALQHRASVTVLPRSREQYQHYAGAAFRACRTLSGVIDIETIAGQCDLFIGAGGTMTREMAVLGVPTISVYQDALLDVDRYLIAEGACAHLPALTGQDALDYLASRERAAPNAGLLAKGRAAYDMIKHEVTHAHA
ncbi:DUF354 domain-containing protein [Massilia oculi]|uniref:DUF354 domain-containing protein n=1 Tax=Massilia oculi TaxID=945844 RepID=A0A2S2DP70_9BURK|nr:DUF354 domain-containing protein [Massilia oculi]AWL07173.1 hypothetical protein DIR46_23930 [Massilia oculi]